MGASGISLFPALDFGAPSVQRKSARCRILMQPSGKETLSQVSPLNSDSRAPVKRATRAIVLDNGLLESPLIASRPASTIWTTRPVVLAAASCTFSLAARPWERAHLVSI